MLVAFGLHSHVPNAYGRTVGGGVGPATCDSLAWLLRVINDPTRRPTLNNAAATIRLLDIRFTLLLSRAPGC